MHSLLMVVCCYSQCDNPSLMHFTLPSPSVLLLRLTFSVFLFLSVSLLHLYVTCFFYRVPFHRICVTDLDFDRTVKSLHSLEITLVRHFMYQLCMCVCVRACVRACVCVHAFMCPGSINYIVGSRVH